MTDRVANPVILLGAGASVPAGLPDVDTLTKDFESFMESEDKELQEAFTFVKSNVQGKAGRFDVELALQALTELTEPTSLIQFFHEKPKEEAIKLGPVFPKLKKSLKRFVRLKCQEVKDIQYLRPLVQSFPDSGLDIFTLNYDPTIETACEIENVSYTDGFDPYWNPQLMEDTRFRVRLFKVHGSVFWFYRGPGSFVKVPVKGELEHLRFFTGEELSELVIYPALEKKTDTGPYPYILNGLRERLWSSDLLVVVGYSFRDNNIRSLVLDQMRARPSLWMMLVSRNADIRKAVLCKEEPTLDTRIVRFNADAKKFIGNRELGEAIQSLSSARTYEEGTRRTQASMSARHDTFWAQSIDNYRRLEHYSKMREIGRELLFTGQYQPSSTQVEATLFDVSLRFGVDELLRANPDESSKWLTFFRDCCVSLDLQQLNNLPKESIPEIALREKLEIILGLPPPDKRPTWSAFLQIRSLKDDLDYSIAHAAQSSAPISKKIVEILKVLGSLTEGLSFNQMPGEGPHVYSKRVAESTNVIISTYGGFYCAADNLVKIAEQGVSNKSLPSTVK